MESTDGTQFDRPIPLRGNGSGAEPERPNPWSRLEAVSAARERLGWLAEHVTEHWYEGISGLGAARLMDELAEEVHQALWGDLAAVERVRHRRPRAQLIAVWDPILDPESDV